MAEHWRNWRGSAIRTGWSSGERNIRH